MANKIYITIFLLFFFAAGFTQVSSPALILSPVIINTTGGFAHDNSSYFEWNVGEESAITTMVSPAITVTNGILQPINPIPYLSRCWDDEEIKYYPNPTHDIVYVHFLTIQTGKITLRLFDISGQHLRTTQFNYFGTGHIEEVDLRRYAAGSYVIDIELDPTGNSIRKGCRPKIIIKLNN